MANEPRRRGGICSVAWPVHLRGGVNKNRFDYRSRLSRVIFLDLRKGKEKEREDRVSFDIDIPL